MDEKARFREPIKARGPATVEISDSEGRAFVFELGAGGFAYTPPAASSSGALLRSKGARGGSVSLRGPFSVKWARPPVWTQRPKGE